VHDTLFEGFYKRLERTPERIAIDIEGQSITFAALYDEIQVTAQRLHATRNSLGLQGVMPIYVDRSLKSAVGIFASLWASVPFTIIDEETPLSLAQDLLARIQNAHPIWNMSETAIEDETQLHLLEESAEWQPGNMEDLAYVILTSGSTGMPKGVMTSRENLTRNKSVNWFDDAANTDYATLAVAPFAFAMGMYGLFRVTKGASYYNLKPANYTPRQFFERMKSLAPTHVSFPAQFARLYSRTNIDIVIESVQEIAIGGEAIRLEEVKALLKNFPEATKALHSLGASEGSSGLQWKHSIHEISGEGQVPLTPTPDASKFVPAPEYGEAIFELWAGLNLAIGYYNNDALTNERFVDQDGRRWWKSGDLVKQVSENEYIHYGRKDDVVKISGYLVSPMSVSNVLMTIPGIAQASVVGEKLEDRYVLHAYVVTKPSTQLGVEEIKISLSNLVPGYMIPKHIYIVDDIPITARGKTDTKSLLSSGPAQNTL